MKVFSGSDLSAEEKTELFAALWSHKNELYETLEVYRENEDAVEYYMEKVSIVVDLLERIQF